MYASRVTISASASAPERIGGVALPSLDERILRAARTRGHGPRRERAIARCSRLGEHGAVWLALGAVGWTLDPPRRPRWARATCTVAGTFALNTTLKLLVRRPRPELPGLPPLTSTPTRLSFPSAHASTSFTGARAYARLGLPAAPLYALASALACSRLYLGVHYPSDILAGAALGTLVSSFAGAASEREAQ
jgi:membrane-associated phospholipid phosphatase